MSGGGQVAWKACAMQRACVRVPRHTINAAEALLQIVEVAVDLWQPCSTDTTSSLRGCRGLLTESVPVESHGQQWLRKAMWGGGRAAVPVACYRVLSLLDIVKVAVMDLRSEHPRPAIGTQ